MRWSITDSPAKPASSAARATPVSQASGLLAPREPADLEHHLEPLGAAPVVARAGSCAARRVIARPQAHDPTRRRDHVHDVPALELEVRDQCAVPLELAGQGGRRHRPVPGGVAAPALGVRRVQHDGHGRQSDLAGPRQPAPTPVLVGAEGVDDGGQPAAGAGRSPRARAGRTRPPSRRGRAARCRPRRAARPRRRSPRGGSGPPPTWTSPSRTGRRGRRAPGREASHPDYGRTRPTRTCWRAEVAASRRGRSSAWPAGRASPWAAAGRCCEPRRQVTGPLLVVGAAPAAAARPRRPRLEGVNVVGPCALGTAHPRHDLVGEAPERRAGQGDDPVRGAAPEPQAGADAAGQDACAGPSSALALGRGARTPWSRLFFARGLLARRGLLGRSLLGRRLLRRAFFATVASWPRSSWPASSSPGPSWLVASWADGAAGGSDAAARRGPVVRPRPVASAGTSGGHGASRRAAAWPTAVPTTFWPVPTGSFDGPWRPRRPRCRRRCPRRP